jgi:hypothetical protein
MTMTACKKGHSKNPLKAGQEAAKDKDLQGSWQTECDDKKMDGIPGGGVVQTLGELTGYAKSSRMIYTFAGNNVTRTTAYYVQNNCSQEALSFVERGEIKIDEDKRTNDQGKQLDLDFRTLTVTVNDQSVVAPLNNITFCGNADWAADKKERDVTRAAKDAKCYNSEVPRKIPTVYRIDAGNLYFGNIQAAGQRPSTVNMVNKFTKK